MNVLVIDLGGANVKILAADQTTPQRFASGPTMTPTDMVSGMKEHTADWKNGENQ